VIAAAKVRARIQRAVEELGEALDHADEWRVK
jgi:predicted ABC-type ATPase